MLDEVSTMLARLNHDNFMVVMVNAAVQRGDEGKLGAILSLVELIGTMTTVMTQDERKATSSLLHDLIDILDRQDNEIN